MSAVEMVVVNGVRYRADDAKRLGLTSDTAKAAEVAGQKQRVSALNKARTATDQK
jgi:hypothetical protein